MTRLHRFLLSILSGVLLSLPWLGFPGWILFVAFVPLLILDEFFVSFKKAFPIVSFWGHVFLAVLIWNILSAWWMAKVSISGVGMAMVLNAFFMSLIWWYAHWVRRRYSSRLGYILLVVLWISLEYLQFNWDIEWPCLQMGSVLANQIKTIQWYEFTGTFGGTLWVLLLNVLFFRIVYDVWQKNYSKRLRINSVVFSILLLAPLAISYRMFYSYVETGNPIQVAIVQPNVDPYSEQFDMDAEREKLSNFLRLAKTVTGNETDFIVGPETVFENQWFWNEDHFKSNDFILQLDSFMNTYPKAELLFGVSSFKVFPDKQSASKTARNKDGILYDRYNTALFLSKSGDYQVYHKSKLVMGVEKTPFLRFIPFVNDMVIDLGGAYGTLGTQAEPTNFVAKDGTPVAPVICFESVFGEYLTEYVKKGAGIIFVITNDGWWKNSRGYKQHLLFSQLRAVETRRSIARAANTGTSCFIDQRGNVLNPTPWWEEAAIKGSVNVNHKITFYVQHGDYIARGALFVSVLLVLFLWVKRFR
ncbi:apolipoprotein N-acyltransferase [uncultured Draconibacterium sp.]|uniref:apolipoprotein N-acyltransferase n=1 Tax=uncultured Draconibacterium sp. TaxID=1573823 RepID=UPI003217B753